MTIFILLKAFWWVQVVVGFVQNEEQGYVMFGHRGVRIPSVPYLNFFNQKL